MSQTIENRLDKIEESLEKMANALADLARFDERLLAQRNETAQLVQRLNNQDKFIRELQLNAGQRETRVNIISRFLWGLLGAGIALLFKFIAL